MKRPFAALLLCFGFAQVLAQVGNEWIIFDQPWIKVPVGETGLYRLTYDMLRDAGVPADTDPRSFRVFHRGSEQAIRVPGEADGVFGPADYILFFGRRNDGMMDTTLYSETGFQPHRYYNLFSDTTSYFLTWGNEQGRRMPVVNAAPSGEPLLTHYYAEKIHVLHASYSAGRAYGSLHTTGFDLGEGWTGPQILHGQTASYKLETITEGDPAGGVPQLEVLLTGRGSMRHHVELIVNGRVLTDVVFEGFESHLQTQELMWSDIDDNGSFTLQVRVTGRQGPDRVSVGYIRLIYPRAFRLEGKNSEHVFLPSREEAALLEFADAPSDVVLLDISSDEVAMFANAGGPIVIPAGAERHVYATVSPLTPGRLKPVRFRRITPGTYDYVIITHPSLRRPAMGYVDPVKAYAEYRALPEGGGFDTLIVNIDQLYDQFNYGETSPRAIHQFLKYLASAGRPDFLFLIGKGLDVNYGYHRRPDDFTTYRDLVPAAGFPAGDAHFSAGLGGDDNVPGIATGRLSAMEPNEVAAYFDKVRLHESLPFDNLNRKKLLHLSGGIETHEPAYFSAILSDLQRVAEDAYLGAHVQPVTKRTTGVKVINVADEVNAGLGLITFFGHSAPNTLDFDIGRVTDPVMGYDNTGKYPFMFMNGCSVGSLFLNGSVFAENWVTTPEKGAIGCIAHSDFGAVTELRRYASLFYDVAFADSLFIHKGVGMVQREVARQYLDVHGHTPQGISQTQQMILLGDPALRLFGADLPDYAVDVTGMQLLGFDDHPVTALADSFRIVIPIVNYGIAQPSHYRIDITRTFDGEVVHYDTLVPAVYHRDTLHITLPNASGSGYGLNRFEIRVDADNAVDELSEDNNTAVFEFFIPLNSTRNLYPYAFGIVSEREVELVFQYTDLLAAPRDFILEIDTTLAFNSPFMTEYVIHASGAGRQAVGLTQEDSTVYYWRTRVAHPASNESSEWSVSSFSYIVNSAPGWAQIAFPQFDANTLSGLVNDPELRRLTFTETASAIDILTFSAGAAKPLDSVSFRINGAEFNLLYEGGACRNNTINLVAFDRHSTRPYPGLYFTWHELLYEYGGRRLLCGREPYVINSFRPNELVTGNDDDLAAYLTNIAVGDSVVVFSMGDAGYSQWPASAYDALGAIGVSAAQVQSLNDGDAVVIFGRKGAVPGTANVVTGETPDGRLNIRKVISGRSDSGQMQSVRIGPATKWDRVVTDIGHKEPEDEVRFSVLGITPRGAYDTLVLSASADTSLAHIEASQYPYLQLIYSATDQINLTAAPLDGWLVFYQPAPEGLIFPRHVEPQTVYEGDSVEGDFGFVNLSREHFADSLTVRYSLAPTRGESPATLRIAAPPPGDTTFFSLTWGSRGREGVNDIDVMVNPRLLLEETYDNNLLLLPGYVRVLRDSIQPVIEVTIDGRYRENNDFVSAEPIISIRVLDDNSHLLRQDTAGVRLFLSRPCQDPPCDFAPVYFSRDDIAVKPATASEPFTVIFTPAELPAGRYVLLVEGEDLAGNPAGDAPYRLAFRVAETFSVDISKPRPNPVTEGTLFDVTIAGDGREPVYCFLLITGIDGRVVLDTAGQLTSLLPGKNTVRWDGKGADGQTLPNGLYVYRLTVMASGEYYRSDGKLVLMR